MKAKNIIALVICLCILFPLKVNAADASEKDIETLTIYHLLEEEGLNLVPNYDKAQVIIKVHELIKQKNYSEALKEIVSHSQDQILDGVLTVLGVGLAKKTFDLAIKGMTFYVDRSIGKEITDICEKFTAKIKTVDTPERIDAILEDYKEDLSGNRSILNLSVNGRPAIDLVYTELDNIATQRKSYLASMKAFEAMERRMRESRMQIEARIDRIRSLYECIGEPKSFNIRDWDKAIVKSDSDWKVSIYDLTMRCYNEKFKGECTNYCTDRSGILDRTCMNSCATDTRYRDFLRAEYESRKAMEFEKPIEPPKIGKPGTWSLAAARALIDQAYRGVLDNEWSQAYAFEKMQKEMPQVPYELRYDNTIDAEIYETRTKWEKILKDKNLELTDVAQKTLDALNADYAAYKKGAEFLIEDDPDSQEFLNKMIKARSNINFSHRIDGDRSSPGAFDRQCFFPCYIKDRNGNDGDAIASSLKAIISYLGKSGYYTTETTLAELKQMGAFFDNELANIAKFKNVSNATIARLTKMLSSAEDFHKKVLDADKDLFNIFKDNNYVLNYMPTESGYSSFLSNLLKGMKPSEVSYYLKIDIEKMNRAKNKLETMWDTPEEELKRKKMYFLALVQFNQEALEYFKDKPNIIQREIEEEMRSKINNMKDDSGYASVEKAEFEYQAIINKYSAANLINDFKKGKRDMAKANAFIAEAQAYINKYSALIGPDGTLNTDKLKSFNLAQFNQELSKEYEKILRENDFNIEAPAGLPSNNKWDLVTKDVIEAYDNANAQISAKWGYGVDDFKGIVIHRTSNIKTAFINSLQSDLDELKRYGAGGGGGDTIARTFSADETAKLNAALNNLNSIISKFSERYVKGENISETMRQIVANCKPIVDDYNKFSQEERKVLDNVISLTENAEGLLNKAKSKPEFDKVLIGKVSIDSIDKEVVLSDNDLSGGKIAISGKVESPGFAIEKVEVSLDGENSWESAGIKGDFKYQFTPQVERVYNISIRATDQVGNTIYAEPKRFKLSYRSKAKEEGEARAKIVEIINTIGQAYRDNRKQEITSHFSKESLDIMDAEDEIKEGLDEMSHLENLKVEVANISPTKEGFNAVVTWDKAILAKDREHYNKNGSANINFVSEGNTIKIASVKNMFWQPIMPEGGSTGGGGGSKPKEQILSGTVTLSSEVINLPHISEATGSYSEYFDFASRSKARANWPGNQQADLYNGYLLMNGNGSAVCDLGTKSIDDMTSVPTEGYTTGMNMLPGLMEGSHYIGKAIAIKTAQGKYALIEVTDYQESPDCSSGEEVGTCKTTFTFNYKYNPSGSPSF